MSGLDGIPEKVKTTEEGFVWFIQNFVRASWFRRLVFILIAFATFANPAVIAHAFAFIGGRLLPPWYTSFYSTVTGLLLLITLIVGLKTAETTRLSASN